MAFSVFFNHPFLQRPEPPPSSGNFCDKICIFANNIYIDHRCNVTDELPSLSPPVPLPMPREMPAAVAPMTPKPSPIPVSKSPPLGNIFS